MFAVNFDAGSIVYEMWLLNDVSFYFILTHELGPLSLVRLPDATTFAFPFV